MDATVAVSLMSTAGVVIVGLLSFLATRTSKKYDQQQQIAANALSGLEKHNQVLSSDNTALRDENKALRSENGQLRKDIDEIGRRDSDHRPPPGPVSVLLVENERSSSELTRIILRQSPRITSVSWVTSVAEAAELDADVILLDLGLEHTDGMDTLRAMRALKPGKPIVVLTDSENFGEESRRLGAVDYLPKPWLVDDHRFPERVAEAAARVIAPLEGRLP